MRTIDQIQKDKEKLRAELDNREQELREVRRETQRRLRHEESERKEIHRCNMSEQYQIPRGDWFDRAYVIAWSHGHSSGFSEVEGYFAEIAELYKIER
jgi:chromosome segregation ATPase